MEITQSELEILCHILFVTKVRDYDHWLDYSHFQFNYSEPIEGVLNSLNIAYTRIDTRRNESDDNVQCELFYPERYLYDIYLGTTDEDAFSSISIATANSNQIFYELCCLDILNEKGYPLKNRFKKFIKTVFSEKKYSDIKYFAKEFLVKNRNEIKNIVYSKGFAKYEKQVQAISEVIVDHLQSVHSGFDISAGLKNKLMQKFESIIASETHTVEFNKLFKVFKDDFLKGYFIERLFYYEKIGILKIKSVDIYLGNSSDEEDNRPVTRKTITFERFVISDIERIAEEYDSKNVRYSFDYYDSYFTLKLCRLTPNNDDNKSWVIHKFQDKEDATNVVWKELWSNGKVNATKKCDELGKKTHPPLSVLLTNMELNGIIRVLFIRTDEIFDEKTGKTYKNIYLNKARTLQELRVEVALELENYLNKVYKK